MAKKSPVKKSPVKKPSPAKRSPLPPNPVTTDRAVLANQIPVEILQQLAAAVATDAWMVGVWRVADGRVYLDRTTINFPNGDLDTAVQLLEDNLKK